MKGKIIGIVAITLLLTTTFVPVTGFEKNIKKTKKNTLSFFEGACFNREQPRDLNNPDPIEILQTGQESPTYRSSITCINGIEYPGLSTDPVSVTIDYPSADITVHSRYITVTGSASTATDEEKITSWAWWWKYNGEVIGSGGDPVPNADSMTFTIDIGGLFLGDNTVEVKVTSNFGGTATDSVKITYDDIDAPALEILSPSDGSEFTSPYINMDVYAHDHYGTPQWGSGVTKIHWHHIWDGGEYEDTYIFDKEYDWVELSIPITLREGANDFTCWAEDLAENIPYEPSPVTYTYQPPVDNTPPVTTKLVGEPHYGDNSYWVSAETPFSFIAEDNPGGSGVHMIYYRFWKENEGWTDWMEYSGSFTLRGTSGNCKYYLEYYAVDNKGNEESVHNQTHVVDNASPLTNLDINGPYIILSDKINIGEDSNIVLISNDTCCDKIWHIVFTIKNFYRHVNFINKTTNLWRGWKDPFREIQIILGIGGAVYKQSTCATTGSTIEFVIDEEHASCEAELQIKYAEKYDTTCFRVAPFWGKDIIRIDCKWLYAQAMKGEQTRQWDIIKKDTPQPGWIYNKYCQGTIEIDFECVSCPTKKSGYKAAYWRANSDEWEEYIQPFTLPEGMYDFEYRGIDNLGQEEPIKMTTIFVDKTAPTTLIPLSPDNNEITNATPRFSFKGEEEEDPSYTYLILQIATDHLFNDITLQKKIFYTYVGDANINVNVANGNLYCDTTYYWRVKASDFVMNADEWSEIRSFTVGDSNAPMKPDTPVGENRVTINESYSYSTSTIDPDGDRICYNFSWGDGTYSGWVGPYASDEVASTAHNWSEEGSYEIKVRAIDEYGAISDWSDPLPVIVPKGKAVNLRVLQYFLENNYYLFPILGQLLNL